MKVSVCVPVYKVEAYIERCARSLFEQTYDDLEFIFVDDCSPDDSVAIVRRVLKNYPDRMSQVKFLRHEVNCGLIAARKTAMSVATGDLLAHCDSDDWIDAGLFQAAVEKFASSDADMVYFSFCREYLDRSVVRESIAFEGPPEMFLGLADSMFGFNNLVNKIYRRKIALDETIEWPDVVGIGEDLCYTAQADCRCRKIVFLQGYYYHYRINFDSMTLARGAAARAVQDLSVVFRVLDAVIPRKLTGAIRRQLAASILYLGVVTAYLTHEEFKTWCRELKQAGGSYDFPGHGKWGLFVMKVADFCFHLSKPLARILDSRLEKVL